MEAVNSRRGDKTKSATQNTFHLEKQLQLGNPLRVREHRTSVPGVENTVAQQTTVSCKGCSVQ